MYYLFFIFIYLKFFHRIMGLTEQGYVGAHEILSYTQV